MNERLKRAFDNIHAEEALKEHTLSFLEAQAGPRKIPGRSFRPARLAAALSCLLILLLFGGGFYLTPVSTISVDINPSLELGVNYFDRVVRVSAFNEDGKLLSGALKLTFKPYTEALTEILETETVQDLLSEDEAMSITVAAQSEEKSSEVMENVESCTAGHQNVYCHAGSSEIVSEAHDAGLSCGKYNAYLQLKELDPSVSVEEIKDLSMREIWDKIEALSSPEDNVSSGSVSSQQEQGQRQHKSRHGNGNGASEAASHGNGRHGSGKHSGGGHR